MLTLTGTLRKAMIAEMVERDEAALERCPAVCQPCHPRTGFAGNFQSAGYNLVGNGAASTGFDGPGDQVGTATNPRDARLGPLPDNGGPTLTHALLPGSPAMNAGDPNFTPPPESDQRGSGFPRVRDGRIDIGALEVRRVLVPPPPARTDPDQGRRGNAVIDFRSLQRNRTRSRLRPMSTGSARAPGPAGPSRSFIRTCRPRSAPGGRVAVRCGRSRCRPRVDAQAPRACVYPYLLLRAGVERSNQVWAMDITYIPMARGSSYLAAVCRWALVECSPTAYRSRWTPSSAVEALEEALARYGSPEIFNTDQGSQFTSADFTDILHKRGIRISMDGKGALARQRVRRAAVAKREVRRGLYYAVAIKETARRGRRNGKGICSHKSTAGRPAMLPSSRNA